MHCFLCASPIHCPLCKFVSSISMNTAQLKPARSKADEVGAYLIIYGIWKTPTNIFGLNGRGNVDAGEDEQCDVGPAKFHCFVTECHESSRIITVRCSLHNTNIQTQRFRWQPCSRSSATFDQLSSASMLSRATPDTAISSYMIFISYFLPMSCMAVTLCLSCSTRLAILGHFGV